MSDIVEQLKTIISREGDMALVLAVNEIESLRQQLDQTIEACAKKLNAQGKQLAECQAQTPLAEGPWEEQAYNAGKKDGRREALLEAEAKFWCYDNVNDVQAELRRMAKELK